MSRVAILISTYNRLELLKNTLRSLKESLRDDKNHIQIYVINDGSTDGTFEWLMEQKGIIGISSGENAGLRDTLNYGLGVCFNQGYKYICYVQDDVEFKKGWLQDCIDCWDIETHLHPCGFVTGHDAPEHKTIMNIQGHMTDFKIKKTCRATHLFASTKRWKKFGFIPDLTPGIAAPKPGQGSLVDWWLVGHPKYPESKNSLRKCGEYVLCIPGLVKHVGVKESTWGNVMNPEL